MKNRARACQVAAIRKVVYRVNNLLNGRVLPSPGNGAKVEGGGFTHGVQPTRIHRAESDAASSIGVRETVNDRPFRASSAMSDHPRNLSSRGSWCRPDAKTKARVPWQKGAGRQ